jgi:hypothetical protein
MLAVARQVWYKGGPPGSRYRLTFISDAASVGIEREQPIPDLL